MKKSISALLVPMMLFMLCALHPIPATAAEASVSPSSEIDELINRGDAIIAQGETEENLNAALKFYETALESDPASTEAVLRIADVMVWNNQSDLALNWLQNNLLTMPEDPALKAKIAEFESGAIKDRDGKERRRERYDGDGNLLWAHVYTYDEQGRMSSVTWLDGNGNLKDVVELAYDDHGRTTKGYFLIGNTGEPRRLEFKNTYDEDGHLIHVKTSTGNEKVYEYNDNGDQTKVESYNSKGQLYERYIDKYDDANRRVYHSREYFKDNKLETFEETFYEYNGGQCVKIETHVNGELSTTAIPHYDENGKQDGSDIYNAAGELIRTWDRDQNGTRTETYYD